MTKTAVICGYGPGISQSLAKRVGAEGYSVALVARTRERLEAGVASLEEAGVTAGAFPCDLSDVAAVKAMVERVRGELGPIGLVHHNAYAGLAGDLLTADPEDLRTVAAQQCLECGMDWHDPDHPRSLRS